MKRTLFFLLLISQLGQGQDLVTASGNFLGTLSEKQKSKASYPLDDGERFNWFFVPRGRNGLWFKDMSEAQRRAALLMLKKSLGDVGYQKGTAIIENENILREVEGRGPDDAYRDPLQYYVTIFGKPAVGSPWFWRFEGHHFSISFACQGSEIVSSTPNFFGSNPGVVQSGRAKGQEILKEETGLGFQLVNSLSDEQKSKAIFSDTALPEIVTGNDRKAMLLEPAGISYTGLTADQQKVLLQLLEVYVKTYELGFSKKLMQKIRRAGIDKLSFAWAGSLKPGAGHYYRIQGPMLLIEYDNTQNNANHVHVTVRDLTNDFAEDLLREHYEKAHSGK